MKKKYASCGIALLTVLILILVFILTGGTPVIKEGTDYISLWSTEALTNADEGGYFASDQTVYTLLLCHELTEDMKGEVISFRTNDSYVDVFLSDVPMECAMDAVSIYHFGEKLKFCDSPGTYTHFIKIPDSDAAYITARVETAYKNKFLTNYDIAVGSENELIFNNLYAEIGASIPNILMAIFGLLLILIYFVSTMKKINVPEALSLGCLSIVFAVYTNCPLFLNQYIFQNAVGQYYMNYFALFLLPLIAMIYFEDIVPKLKMNWLFCAFLILEFVLSALHFLQIASYTRTIKIFSAALGIFAVISLIMIAMHFKNMTDMNKIAIITLLSFVLINVVFFIFVSTVGNQSFIAKAGFLIYLVLGIVSGLRKITVGFFQERENELLYEIAFTDNLTKLGNRYSLERDAGTYALESVSIVSLDLNYLKFTNDTFGHAAGDVLLKSAAKCMSAVYEKIYRVGGDEFIALVCSTNQSELEQLNRKLKEQIAAVNRDRHEFGEFAEHSDFRLSIAVGYASYASGDKSYEQIMNRADEAMYCEKKRLHSAEQA